MLTSLQPWSSQLTIGTLLVSFPVAGAPLLVICIRTSLLKVSFFLSLPFADAAAKLQDTEFARLTLENHVCQVEAKVVRLEADLETQAEQVGYGAWLCVGLVIGRVWLH